MDIGVTLGAVAIIGPAVQACWDAYGLWSDTKVYGQEYQLAVRKLRSQRVILETLLNLRMDRLTLEDPPQGPPIFEAIRGELINMKQNFEICRDLISKLAIDSRPGVESKPSAFKGFKTLMQHHRKSETAVSNTSRSGDSKTTFSQPLSPSSSMVTTSTESSSSSLPPRELLSEGRFLAAKEKDQLEAEVRQNSASLFRRLKWSLIQRDKFDRAIKELKQNNSNLHHLVPPKEHTASARLLDQRKASTGSLSEIKDIQMFVSRLHRAILSVNNSNNPDRLSFSVRLVNNHERTREL